MPDLGITRVSTPDRDQKWRGSTWGSDMGQPVAIAAALLATGEHYDAHGWIPEGLPLGYVKTGTYAGKYGPFDSAATDGRELLAGFLTEPQQLENNFGGISTQVINATRQIVGVIVPEFVPTKPKLLNGMAMRDCFFIFLGADRATTTA